VRKFCVLGKNVSPLSTNTFASTGCLPRCILVRLNDGCREFEEKNVSPLSGIHLSVFRGCFRFAPSGDRGSLVLGVLFPSFRVKSFGISFDRVEAFLAFVWYLLLFGAEGFFGSGLLKGRRPLAFILYLLCLLCR